MREKTIAWRVWGLLFLLPWWLAVRLPACDPESVRVVKPLTRVEKNGVASPPGVAP
jgi:hypothetical protein